MNQLQLEYISTDDIVANIFTKSLSHFKLVKFCTQLDIIRITPWESVLEID